MKIRFFLTLLCLQLLSAVHSTTFAQTADASRSDALADSFGKLPLSFEVNQGQSDSGVKFLSHGNGYSLFLTDSAAVLVLSKHEDRSKLPGRNAVRGDVIRMELSGASSKTAVRGVEELPGKANYFIGNDPAKWRAGVPTYARVRYEGVYPGVDLIYYGNQRKLEYDFVVSANADPTRLRLHFVGAQRLRVTASGDLTIKARNGEIAFQKPVVYQMKDSVRRPVEGRFQLLTRNDISFRLGTYDRTRELVIDPALAYSTYLGGSGCLDESLDPSTSCNSGNAIAVDAAGDAYVVGGTVSADFPVTAEAFQKVNNAVFYLEPGNQPVHILNNAFVTKFDPKGSTLIYSTYLGGDPNFLCACIVDGDVATGVAVDASGNAYVTGHADSGNFPVTNNAYQKVNYSAGLVGANAFVTKLNPSGSALVYSTYVGGSGGGDNYVYGDSAVGIAIDSAGSAYIAGTALSPDFPVTTDAFQKVNNSIGPNLFVTKFNPAGSALVYSTYLGGSGIYAGDILTLGDTAGGIAIDSAGDAYVTGTAYSRDFPVTTNAYQKVNNSPYYGSGNGGGSNAIVTEVNPTGSALVYSTYLGGSGQDGGNAVAVNAAGNAYVTGSAGSADFPVTPGAFQKTNTGGGDAFVTELNSTGSALVYSTFLGGTAGDVGNSIALDAFGSAYITGATGSTDFPVTSDAFRKANHSPAGGNAFVTKLDPSGSTLLYSSYIGGNAEWCCTGDSGHGIAVDWFGDAYITGTTCSSDFPLAGVPFQAKNKYNGCSIFVSKFIVNTVTGTSLVSDSNPAKVGTKVTFTAGVKPNVGTTIPTGSVVFSLDGTPQVTVPLDDTGYASYSTSALAAGRHIIMAAYLGSATDSGSSDDLGQMIIGASARIAVTSGTFQTAPEGSPFALPLEVQVQDARGTPVPGAVVNFNGSGLTFSGNPAVTNADGQASVVTTATTTGSLTAAATTAGVSTPATFKLTATPAP